MSVIDSEPGAAGATAGESGAGVVGLLLGAWMKSTRPDTYARIGEGAGAEK